MSPRWCNRFESPTRPEPVHEESRASARLFSNDPMLAASRLERRLVDACPGRARAIGARHGAVVDEQGRAVAVRAAVQALAARRSGVALRRDEVAGRLRAQDGDDVAAVGELELTGARGLRGAARLRVGEGRVADGEVPAAE